MRGLTVIDVGQVIRSTRKAQGLRQDELAGLAGVGVRFLVEVERGKPTVQLGLVLSLLAVLGCDIEIRPPSEVTP